MNAITWNKISEAGIDTDRVTQTSDGCWHVSDDDGTQVVHFSQDGDWIEISTDDGGVQDSIENNVDFALARVAQLAK